jgi:hypothetical protein
MRGIPDSDVDGTPKGFTVSQEGIPMSRRTSTYIAAACLALAALTSACDRVDATGPSEAPSPSYEVQGGNS